MWRALAGILAAAAVAALAAPGLAHAPAPGFRSSVRAIEPPLPGVAARVVGGVRIRLVNGGRERIVVLGYEGQPWRRVPPGATREWHDLRVHWPATALPHAVAAAPRRRHHVLDWRVPLVVGGRPHALVGSLDYVPPPLPARPGYVLPLVPFALVALAALFVVRRVVAVEGRG
jgi:hypothetical protein